MNTESAPRTRAASVERLNVTDFMTIGIFFVVITIVSVVVAFVGITPVTFIMISPLQALVLGIPTMLFYSKVKKPGMLFIMALLSGLFALLMALGPYALIAGLLLSLVAELILWSGRYESARNSVLAYAVTSLATTATYAPLFFATKNYLANTNMEGKYGAGMAQGMADIGQYSYLFVVVVAVTFVLGLLGGVLGRRTFDKHFRRAGIV